MIYMINSFEFQESNGFHSLKTNYKTKSRELEKTINTYRTAVSPTLDLLCHEDFNVGRSEAESNIEIFMAQ